jgi:hypothetical protein
MQFTSRHHLQCRRNQSTFIRRHTAICKIMATLAQDEATTVDREKPEGPLRHDVVTHPNNNPLTRTIIDVNVSAITEQTPIIWPSEHEITEAAAREAERITEHDFEWENHDNETACTAVYRGRALRRLCLAAATTKTIGAATKGKLKHFQERFKEPTQNTTSRFIPFILTAGGALGSEGAVYLSELMHHQSQGATREKIKFRRNARSSIAIKLVLYSHLLSAVCHPLA